MSAHVCEVCEQSSGRISVFILCDDCRVQNRLNLPNTGDLDSGNENSLSSSTESIENSLGSRNSGQPNIESELNALNQNLTQESNLNEVSKVRDGNITCCTRINGSNCLEIHGLHFGVIETQNAETFQKKIKEITVEVGQCYDVQFSNDDINEVFILAAKIVQLPVLLVEFKSKEIRDRLLAVRKKKVTNADLPINSMWIRRFDYLRKRIYVNESLCFCFKNLYDCTREVAKRKGFKFIWVKGGNLFVRKYTRSPKELITCVADLHKLIAD